MRWPGVGKHKNYGLESNVKRMDENIGGEVDQKKNWDEVVQGALRALNL